MQLVNQAFKVQISMSLVIQFPPRQYLSIIYNIGLLNYMCQHSKFPKSPTSPKLCSYPWPNASTIREAKSMNHSSVMPQWFLYHLVQTPKISMMLWYDHFFLIESVLILKIVLGYLCYIIFIWHWKDFVWKAQAIQFNNTINQSSCNSSISNFTKYIDIHYTHITLEISLFKFPFEGST